MIRYLLLSTIVLALVAHRADARDTLIVGYTSAPPFVIDEGDIPKGIDPWLWEQVAHDLDITYRYQRLSFGELLNHLEEGRIDVCINPLTMTAERSRAFLFTSPFFVSHSTAAIRTTGHRNSFLHSLRPLFSKRFIGGLISLFALIWMFGTLTWLVERRTNREKFRPGWRGILDGLWWSIVTMTTVGYGDKTPKTGAGKMIAVLWMLTALLFLSSLTASLASLLVHEDEEDHTAIELEQLRQEEVGTMANSSMQAFLHNRFFQNISTYEDIGEGLHDVANGSTRAFIYDEPILSYRIHDLGLEKLSLIDDQFNTQLYAFGVSKSLQELDNKIAERILHYTSSLQWKTVLGEYNLKY